MQEKKNIIKIILIVIIVLIIIVYNFFIKKEEFEEFDYSDFIVDGANSIENNNLNEIINEKNKIKVYVIGEVKNPGVVEIEEGDRIEDAIILAGGTTENTDLSKINLAYYLEDGQKIVVPSIHDNIENEGENNNEDLSEAGVVGESSNDSKVNINTASETELQTLSGIGESLAERIVTYREENGKFKNIEDIKNVSGIGDKKFESLKEYIKVK